MNLILITLSVLIVYTLGVVLSYRVFKKYKPSDNTIFNIYDETVPLDKLEDYYYEQLLSCALLWPISILILIITNIFLYICDYTDTLINKLKKNV